MGDVQDTPRAVTRRLLLELFTPDELRRFIADHWPALEHLLPGGLASSDALADAVVRGLERRGAIGELCARLADEFPRRKEEVEACAARWRTRPAAPEDPDEAAWRRLRTAFAAGHATIHLLGFPHRGSKPAVRLQDACVPLRMRRGESVVAWTVQRLLAHLRLDGDASARNAAGDVGDEGVRPAARVLVLGDPGSGKSTLCQYLTVLLAGGVRRPGLAIPEVVPLHFRLRDVTRRGGSLLQAIRDRAAEFGVDVGVDVLTRACEAGRAVLIVDGLDEVGDVAARMPAATPTVERMHAVLAQVHEAIAPAAEVGDLDPALAACVPLALAGPHLAPPPEPATRPPLTLHAATTVDGRARQARQGAVSSAREPCWPLRQHPPPRVGVCASTSAQWAIPNFEKSLRLPFKLSRAGQAPPDLAIRLRDLPPRCRPWQPGPGCCACCRDRPRGRGARG